jgi:hypothetical protein
MRIINFELKLEHIKLLKAVNVQWNYACFGAPEVDPARPYGNAGDYNIYEDMCKALDLKPLFDNEGDIECSMRFTLAELHKELKTALQIVLQCQTFEPGIFEAEKYFEVWKRVKG